MRNQRVLIIEDNPEQSTLVARWLEQEGWHVDLASTGMEAMCVATQSCPQIALVDVELPDVNGIALANKLRKLSPALTVVVMTAHEKFSYAQEAIRVGAADYLVKPLHRSELLSKLGQLSTMRVVQSVCRTVLAIGAHPDDVEIACGGTLLGHHQRGDRVVVLTLSRGAAGGTIGLRTEEARLAAKALGAELHLADLPDTTISHGQPTIGVIAELVQSIQPDIVYTHSNRDIHQDHRAVHHASLVACRNVANLFCYQSPSAQAAFCPNQFVDISNSLSEKLDLISLYRSQTEKCAYLDPELITATARYWARFSQVRFVEPFETIRASASIPSHPSTLQANDAVRSAAA